MTFATYAKPDTVPFSGPATISADPGSETDTGDDFEPAIGKLVVHFVDVGQGDSTFIECPNGNVIVVDAGSVKGKAAKLPRATQLLGKLTGSIKKVHALVVTHPDQDHYNMLPDVLAGHTVENLFIVGDWQEYKIQAAQQWLQALEPSGTTMHHLDIDVNGNAIEDYFETAQNETIDCGSASVYILAAAAATGKQPNAGSIVLGITHGDFDVLLTGDALESTENFMIDKHGKWLESEVLKVGHHGADTSTSALWVDTVKPSVAVVSASDHGSFYHPREVVITRLLASPHLETTDAHSLTSGNGSAFTTDSTYTKAIFNTHDAGTITITSTGDSYSIDL